MSKFIILLVVASLVACISAGDDNFGDGFSDKLGFFNSDKAIDSIKNLGKPLGGHASGHAKTYSHETKSVNGVPTLDESKTDDVDNKDGRVAETKSNN